MTNFLIYVILKYLILDNIDEFAIIKNNILHYHIKILDYKRLRIKDASSLEKLAKVYHLYSETINIKFLNTDYGKKFIKKLSSYNFSDQKNIYLTQGNNTLIHFLSFCELKNLQEICLYDKQMSDKAIEYLIDSNFSQLKELNLYKSNITDKAIEYLVKCNFNQLQKQYLSDTLITDKSIEYLFYCKFNQLQKLHLDNNEISIKV